MATLIRWVIAMVLALTVLPWTLYHVVEVWQSRSALLPPVDRWWAVGGFLLAIPVVLWNRPNAFFHTLVHEACHALFCLLLGVKVTSFQVTDGQGGAVGHQRVDPVRGTIISIAPYTLPLLLAIPLLLRHWITEPSLWRSLLTALIAFLYVHHLHALYFNVRINLWGRQSDLYKVGRPLSAVLIAIALLWTTLWTVTTLW